MTPCQCRHPEPVPAPAGRPLTPGLIARVRAAAASSELLRAAASVRRDGGASLALGEAAVRPLTAEEVERLEALGNTAEAWSRVRVADGFDCRRVRQSSFHGEVVLGRFTGAVDTGGGLRLPAGVYQSTLADCVVGHEALVRDVKLLANHVVGAGALVWDCGRVTCDAGAAFGNGAALPVGIECGGRDLPVYAEIDGDVAAAVARPGDGRGLLSDYRAAVADYAARAACGRGVIGPGAVVRNTPRVHNAYLGPGARVDGATLVADSTLLSSPEEPAVVEAGACVTGSLLQWGSRVSGLALVERSVLLEHAHAERHGKVTASLLGCNTGVAGGEVTSCLLGPFVGFHHQALLIAAVWPEGKGNVGYGANVGSNHTSKAPDQEFWPGEGLFLGLGVNVKYPCDFSRSPYSVVASGVSLLPQRVRFPFSLINTPSARCPGVPPAYNEILPGWVLTDNLYAVRRNEAKYRARNRARRARLEFEVFRPDVVDLLRDALGRLEGVPAVKEVYTERDVDGLGKNYLLERNRRAAVEAYRFFIRHYALLGLKARAEAALARGGPGAIAELLTTDDAEDARWEHQRRLLADLGVREVASALRELPRMLEHVARSVERSKARDDERGARVIDDYAEVHPPAEQDPFVQETWREADRLRREVGEVLDRLGAGGAENLPAGPAAPEALPDYLPPATEKVA